MSFYVLDDNLGPLHKSSTHSATIFFWNLKFINGSQGASSFCDIFLSSVNKISLFFTDWATLINPHIFEAAGDYLSPHTFKRHVLNTDPKYRKKSKIRINGSSYGELWADAERKIMRWTSRELSRPHAPFDVRRAVRKGWITITFEVGEVTGYSTFDTPEGTITFERTGLTLVVDESDATLYLAYPDGRGYTSDGLSSIGPG